jgi:hypothetical protein
MGHLAALPVLLGSMGLLVNMPRWLLEHAQLGTCSLKVKLNVSKQPCY